MTAPERILLVRLSALGDCLHAVPFVEAVREQCPQAEIGWLIQGGGLALLSDYPAVDRFHVFDRKAKGMDRWRSLRRLRAQLRAQRYDVVVDLQGLTKSGVLARLAGARRVVGFGAPESRELNSWFVHERVAVDASVEHVVDRNLQLLPAVGLSVPDRASWRLPTIELQGTAIGRQQADVRRRAGDRPLAVFNPGTTWPSKIWPPRHFAGLARILEAEGFALMLSWGGAEEEGLADRIVELCTEQGTAIVKAEPTDLVELRGLYQEADLVVANDSGPLHLAVAVGTPAVGVYGPTDPARNGPYGWQDASWPSRAVSVASPDQASTGQATGRAALVKQARNARSDNSLLQTLKPETVADQVLDLLGK